MEFSRLDIQGHDANPVDIIETCAALRDWKFERSSYDEISVCVGAFWSEYDVSFSWMGEVESLHTACAFDFEIDDDRAPEVLRLLALVNQRMPVGHFEWWMQSSLIIYRHALPLDGGALLSNRQIERMLNAAIEACESYFQAFQFVRSSGHDAKYALSCATFETKGEA